MQQFSEYYEFAREFAVSTRRSIFLTGKAGTGKTTFLRNLQKLTKKQMAVVAPTGVAAINAGGTTIHSFFQLPFTPFIPTVEGRKELVEKIKMQGYRRKVIQELELLVIDEISMVRADVLDAIDTVLRYFRHNFLEPFGGVQLIFIGDMFQLSPVAIEEEWRLLAPYYRSPYFFHSQVVAQQTPVYIELDKIFRQTNEQFIRVLNEIRNNQLTNTGLELLQSRYNPGFIPSADDTWITLTTHNYKAERINADELVRLKGHTSRFKAKITGDFPEKSFPAEETLELKIGAKVMFVKNDVENPRRFFNGKIGMVEEMADDAIRVRCPEDNELIEVGRMQWENIRYTTNASTRQIEEDTLGTFVQYPLRLAWAITIHKSQGLTFDKAIIDAGDAFAAGQVYVALSRCRSLEGMVLRSRINPQSIENDRQIVEHEKQRLPDSELQLLLDKSRQEFIQQIILQLFDYRMPIGFASRLSRTVEEVAGSFNEETIPFLKEIIRQLQNLQEVASKFQHQLQRIFDEGQVMNRDYLNERITAATAYFLEKTLMLTETIRQSPAQTDSRDNAREYADQLTDLFVVLSQKTAVMRGLKGDFNVEDYFVLKNTFIVPEIKINAYSKIGDKKATTSSNPKLFYQLINLRNKICEPKDLPIYLVAGSKTLEEMAEYLPFTKEDLLKINGFGPAKAEKYGEMFLEVIRQYCAEHHLSTKMKEKQDSAKQKKDKKETPEKKEKGESQRQSFEMFKEGKSVDEIAAERGLTPATICGHLGKFIALGEISIDQFISAEKREKAIRMIIEKDEEVSVYQTLIEILTPHEINFFLSWWRIQQ